MQWKLFFDGLTEPRNPGGCMGFGWVLDRGEAGMESDYGAILPRPENTNNVAEYLALYKGLCIATQLRQGIADASYPGILIYGDSQLVCYQIDRKWQVKNERLQVAHAKCLELLNKLGPWAIEWIPREQNLLADELSRKAYFSAMGKEAPKRGAA